MNRTALIVAEAAEERRAIAQTLKSTELFNNISFCDSPKEIGGVFNAGSVDLICAELNHRRKDTLTLNSTLTRSSSEQQIPLVFFSTVDPEELSLLGILPSHYHCLSYETPSPTVSALMKRLLCGDQGTPDKQFPPAGESQLIDANSGTYNRFYFDAILDQEISRSRLTGRPFSLLLIEPISAPPELAQIALNNWYTLLPDVALIIKGLVRTSDLLCRVEKKRLALLLPETCRQSAEQVINRIRERVTELAEGLQDQLKFGLVTPPLSAPLSRHALLSLAEEAL